MNGNPSPLRLLFWESTARCNLACIHCRRLDVAEAAAKEDLTTDQMQAVIESAATLGRPIIVLSGGEPLLRPDWEELAACAKGLTLPTALATNGTLIDSAMAQRIAKAGFHRVSVSLDGADGEIHDAFRGVPGCFDKAIAGTVELRYAGVPFQINATIAAHNADQLPELYALARSLGAMALHLFLLVPVGCGVQIEQTHQLTPSIYEDVLQWVCDRQEGPLELKATCAPHYYRLAAQRGRPARHSRGCLAGTAVCFVSHKGDVFPCGYLPVSCGSVKQQPLAEIWRTSTVFADLRDFARLKGKCGLCEFRGVCGGCRARAYALAGDYLAAEPLCKHIPVRMQPDSGAK